MCRLEEFAAKPAGDLPIGCKKRLELARALAAGPTLLMLDEVMAGLTSTEVKGAVELLCRIRDTGVTLLVVEHVIEAIVPIADTLVVLDGGVKIAEGPPGAGHPRRARDLGLPGRSSAGACRPARRSVPMPEPILSLTDVHAGYDGVPVVFGVSLEVMPGELVAIVGANGAGKTTTLRAVAGLNAPLRGAIRFQGRDISPPARPPDARARRQLRARGAAGVRQALGREEPRRSAPTRRLREQRGPAPPGRDDGALPGARRRARQTAETLRGGEQRISPSPAG